MYAPLRIACVQMHAAPLALEENLLHAEQLIREAAKAGAELIVLPELFNIGSGVTCREEAYRYSEVIPEGQTSRFFLSLASELGVLLCASYIERTGVDLYNTAVLIGPEGLIGKFRKLHLCGTEVCCYEPGDLGIPVFHTRFGRIAMLICLDAYYPETFRIAAMQGADLVLVPFNSQDAHDSNHLGGDCHTMVPALCQANAVSNRIFVVGCDRVGVSGSYVSAGQSVIANTHGAILGGIAPFDREVVLYADIDLSDARRKNVNAFNSRLGSRRTDVYSATLGYEPEKYHFI